MEVIKKILTPNQTNSNQVISMDPISILLAILKRYWWVLVILALVVYVSILRNSIELKDKAIEKQQVDIAVLQNKILDFKSSIATQNKAIDELTQKGKEQASRLESAIAKVNAMKPATQVIIREIYSDKTKDIEQLLLNAVND